MVIDMGLCGISPNDFQPKKLIRQLPFMSLLSYMGPQRKGIKRGQVVKSINGVSIVTRKDIAPFIADESIIKEVEVVDGK